jgi:hypothetical protein
MTDEITHVRVAAFDQGLLGQLCPPTALTMNHDLAGFREWEFTESRR